MAAVKNRFIISIIILVLGGTIGIVYFTQQQNENRNTAKIHNENAVTSFTIQDLLPPKFTEDLNSYFEEQGWVEKPSGPGTIKVYQTDAIPAVASAINLYQILVAVKPYRDYLDNSPVLEIGVSQDIDMANPQAVLGKKLLASITVVTPEMNNKIRLIPAEQLNPTVIQVEPALFLSEPTSGEMPLLNHLAPIIFHIVIEGPADQLEDLENDVLTHDYLTAHYFRSELPSEEDFVTVMKTGTTVAGGPGWELCERTKGFTYPISNIKDELAAADITIISNESSFVDGCSQMAGTTAFCGKPSYIQNLLDIGTDIISLTGNHMCDYGKNAFLETLTGYSANSISYFGGGKNKSEAFSPLIVETKAGTLAFIGINNMGPAGVIATEESAGAAYFDHDLFIQEIDNATQNADIVWVDTQLWPEYGTTPGADQLEISQLASEQGAAIITGVSSHELQGMTYLGNTPVFYGLGNFLFDQMWSQETRQGLVLKITLFENKIIDMKLMPTILYDYCQVRFAGEQEKYELLRYFLNISTFDEEQS